MWQRQLFPSLPRFNNSFPPPPVGLCRLPELPRGPQTPLRTAGLCKHWERFQIHNVIIFKHSVYVLKRQVEHLLPNKLYNVVSALMWHPLSSNKMFAVHTLANKSHEHTANFNFVLPRSANEHCQAYSKQLQEESTRKKIFF